MADPIEARGRRKDPTGHTETLGSSSLIKQARVDSAGFVGRQLEIPEPPQLLLTTLASLQAIGLNETKGIFFPRLTLGKADNYPGWKTRIGNDYYDWLKAGQVSKASPALSGFWAIVDTSQRPDYAPTRHLKEKWEAVPKGTIQHPNDPEPHNAIEQIIRDARSKGEIETRDYWGAILPYLPTTSRFGVSTDEQDGIVFPRLAKAIGLKVASDAKSQNPIIEDGKVEVRRPTLAEINYLGNLDRFIHLNKYGTSEAVLDVYRGILDPKDQEAHKFPRAIITGNTRREGVGQIDYILADDHADAVSFRFMIAFPLTP